MWARRRVLVSLSQRGGTLLTESRLGSTERYFISSLCDCRAFRFSEYQNEIILFSLE